MIRRLLVGLAAALLGGACTTQPLDTPNPAPPAGGSFELGGTLSDCATAGGAAGEGGASTSDCASAPVVSYTNDVAPILAHCVGEACHDFAISANVQAWIGAPADECCNRRDLIAPEHPEQSYLIDKLRGRKVCAGVPMPRGRAPLPESDIATLEAWICQGAQLH